MKEKLVDNGNLWTIVKRLDESLEITLTKVEILPNKKITVWFLYREQPWGIVNYQSNKQSELRCGYGWSLVSRLNWSLRIIHRIKHDCNKYMKETYVERMRGLK